MPSSCCHGNAFLLAAALKLFAKFCFSEVEGVSQQHRLWGNQTKAIVPSSFSMMPAGVCGGCVFTCLSVLHLACLCRTWLQPLASPSANLPPVTRTSSTPLTCSCQETTPVCL